MFLITGYPRSGTAYTTTLLKKAGIDVMHEHEGLQGVVSWLHIRSGQWLYDIPQLTFTRIIHQVRDPLRVISSAMTLGDYSFGYMLKHIATDRFQSKLHMVMHTYLHWNRMIEPEADMRVRVEELGRQETFRRLVTQLGFSVDLPQDIDRDINTRKGMYVPLSWDDLFRAKENLAKEILKMKQRYGYE